MELGVREGLNAVRFSTMAKTWQVCEVDEEKSGRHNCMVYGKIIVLLVVSSCFV